MQPATLIAFALVTTLSSLVPGPNMMFIMTHSVWRGARSGLAALVGLELGNLVWFVMAGLGLGALMHSAPLAFAALTLAGIGTLAWMGIQALRSAMRPESAAQVAASRPSRNALSAGFAVALGNPKSLVYMTALLPPFVDLRAPTAPQLAWLALVALSIDVVVSLAYIYAGNRISTAVARPEARMRLDLAVGTAFILIAIGVAWHALPGLRSVMDTA